MHVGHNQNWKSKSGLPVTMQIGNFVSQDGQTWQKSGISSLQPVHSTFVTWVFTGGYLKIYRYIKYIYISTYIYIFNSPPYGLSRSSSDPLPKIKDCAQKPEKPEGFAQYQRIIYSIFC